MSFKVQLDWLGLCCLPVILVYPWQDAFVKSAHVSQSYLPPLHQSQNHSKGPSADPLSVCVIHCTKICLQQPIMSLLLVCPTPSGCTQQAYWKGRAPSSPTSQSPTKENKFTFPWEQINIPIKIHLATEYWQSFSSKQGFEFSSFR